GAGSARRPSRRPSMALVDLANGLLLDSGGEPAVVLEPTGDAAALSAAAENGGVVAIRFPSFGDGRGHSLAVLLRERHGFTGGLSLTSSRIPRPPCSARVPIPQRSPTRTTSRRGRNRSPASSIFISLAPVIRSRSAATLQSATLRS